MLWLHSPETCFGDLKYPGWTSWPWRTTMRPWCHVCYMSYASRGTRFGTSMFGCSRDSMCWHGTWFYHNLDPSWQITESGGNCWWPSLRAWHCTGFDMMSGSGASTVCCFEPCLQVCNRRFGRVQQLPSGRVGVGRCVQHAAHMCSVWTTQHCAMASSTMDVECGTSARLHVRGDEVANNSLVLLFGSENIVHRPSQAMMKRYRTD